MMSDSELVKNWPLLQHITDDEVFWNNIKSEWLDLGMGEIDLINYLQRPLPSAKVMLVTVNQKKKKIIVPL